jgi:hypothetical protein
MVAFLVSIPIAFLSPTIAQVSWFLVVIWGLLYRLRRRAARWREKSHRARPVG